MASDAFSVTPGELLMQAEHLVGFGDDLELVAQAAASTHPSPAAYGYVAGVIIPVGLTYLQNKLSPALDALIQSLQASSDQLRAAAIAYESSDASSATMLEQTMRRAP